MKLEFSINNNAGSLFNEVSQALKQKGGSLTGDQENGKINYPTPLGSVLADYTITNNKILINVTDIPFLIPDSLVESELKKFFENK